MDSLSEAIDYYINGKKHTDERCYKFCIFMLYHSTELILKLILYREHKVLIFENIEDYKESDDIKTIGFATALKRVKKICKVDFGRYYNYLEDIANIRNKFQHYEINIEVDALIKVIISTFSTIEYLIYNALDTHFDDFGDLISREQIEELHSDQETYSNRKKDIVAEIKLKSYQKVTFEYSLDKHIPIPCPKCAETFLVFNDSSIKCLYCGEKYNSIDDLYSKDKNCIISNYMERELSRREIMFDELRECLNCSYRTLILDNNIWKCAACGTECCDDELRHYAYLKGKEDWEADIADMMEDPHYSHLWK
ncbi:MAG: hypothetical protein CVV02_17630 [Firmicutes bacterium HGW-Firmicutes-7]|nr:MAG: hypothetical protein CVV02_17630 [Firmicutes bacterium HGW-Firmicutes-7]